MIPSNRISTHPGVILLKEFLGPLEVTQKALALHFLVVVILGAVNANVLLMKTSLNITLKVILFYFSDMASETYITAIFIPCLLFISVGVFIYRHYKKSGHDDSSSSPGGGLF